MPYFRRSLSPESGASTTPRNTSAQSNPVDLARWILTQESSELPSAPLPAGPALFETVRLLPGDRTDDRQDLPVILSNPPQVVSGSTAEFRFALLNQENHPVSCSPVLSDFISDAGYLIPGGAVKFPQSPISLAANAPTPITCSVAIPAAAAPGRYHALLTVAPAESDPVVLQLKVVAAHA